MKRIHIFISGKVQGVFFRAFATKEAEKLGIKGWVKNLADGRVEVMAEGGDEELNKLISRLKKGPDGAEVYGLSVEEEEYTGEFDSF